jgi:uncharacterized protein YuzE
MKDAYLEVTFRRGRPVAGYYYLPRRQGEKSVRALLIDPGLVVDFNRAGKPIGIEITAPDKITLPLFNSALKQLGLPVLKRADLAPLKAA